MSDKPRPAEDNPGPATDQAKSDGSNQVKGTLGEQGPTTAAEEANSQVEGDQGEIGNLIPAEASTETAETENSVTTKGNTTEPADPESISAAEGNEPTINEPNNITMEDVLAASDDELARKPVHRGMVTTGEIIMLSKEGIVVDVASKIEGLLPYNQIFEYESNAEDAAKYFKPGDKIQVYVVRSDIPNNIIVLSKRRADQERAWNLLQEIHDKKKPVEVEIVEKVKGGLVGNLGIRAFLPASHIDIRRVSDLSEYVDKRLRVKIIELNRKRNRVIISRRSILEEEVAETKAETLRKLEPGSEVEGEVVEITDFGVFVNLGGIDGLVHRSELSHGRFSHPREVVEVGNMVKVQVLDMDLERERINLSMKNLAPNPWESVLSNYVIGQKIPGKVTNLTQFGAFIEIEPGLEGLIHVSELSWTKRIRHPKELLSEGDDVETMILKIDTDQQRISLGLRQMLPDPWSSLPDQFPAGSEVTGPVTGITDFGVFMEITEGIEGLIHISELTHEHIEDVTEHFSRGDEVTAVILNIDPVEQRASLSRKRLLPFSAGQGGSSAPSDYSGGKSGGNRRTRRGRRNSDIDYDYSYASEASGTKSSPKLGDVYADLFAQFGLTESGEGNDTATKDEAQKEAVTASGEVNDPVESNPIEEPEQGLEAVDVADLDTDHSPSASSSGEVAETSTEGDSEVDPENAIDAAEAAALLTAAFREGKRPTTTAEDATEEVLEAGQDADTSQDVQDVEIQIEESAEEDKQQA
jgi:small subunit ribosomal protein S1